MRLTAQPPSSRRCVRKVSALPLDFLEGAPEHAPANLPKTLAARMPPGKKPLRFAFRVSVLFTQERNKLEEIRTSN